MTAIEAPTHDAILDLYHKGQMLRAYELSLALGPMKQWRGAPARVLAGRLAMNLGAPSLGRVLHRLAYRESPDDPYAIYYCARAILDRRGPLPAWRFMRKIGMLDEAPDSVRADWLAFHSQILGLFRDFDAAEQYIAKAEQLAPQRPWICVERSDLLERQDRYEEAAAAVRRSLDLHPWYRPGVQNLAQVLQLLDRDNEALALLREASEKLQNAPILMQLAALETELGLHSEARQSLDRALALSPLLDKSMERWFNCRRSDAAYYCGDFETAAALAEKNNKSPFHEQVAKKLRETQAKGRRVLLPVGFVRQHHMTCAPATLSALSRFWSMPAEHLEVAEAICYDGTPARSERLWAEQNGFVVREFTVTWDTAMALIDRGIPFTFTTVEATSAHLQAVIGYEGLRGTLLVRDPYLRNFSEFIAEATFKRYASTGPRGMAMVPRDRSSLLDGIELPDVRLYDLMYEVQQALAAHDRDRAHAARQSMIELAPDHRLTLWARRSIAGYDSDTNEGLATVEKLLELFPDDANLQLSKLSYLRVLARRDERLSLLRSICDKRTSDPIFWLQLASELRDDAREQPAVMQLIRRSLRYRPVDSNVISALGHLLWDQRRFDEASELYRFAACIADKDENLVRSYFIASRHLKETAAAFAMLSARFARLGRRSSAPARSLFWAYDQVNRSRDAFDVLEQAVSLRPGDGELKLYAASAHARCAHYSIADRLLTEAKGACAPLAWLRTSADIATYKGESLEAVELWRKIIDADPLAADAHSTLARLLAETQSHAAAREHLERTANRFPYNYRLVQLWLNWLRDEGPQAYEPGIRRLIDIHPADGWARRELVWVLVHTGRVEQALEEAEISLRLEPTNPSAPFYRGLVLAQMGRIEEAREMYRAAISLSVDADYAISSLVQSCDTQAQEREALAFVQQELVRQTIFGEALLAFRSHAGGILGPDALLASLREALAARPDLWHAWAAVILHLLDMGQNEQAEKLAVESTERFPLLPRTWLDLATVYRARHDFDAEIAALQTTLELSPGWGTALRALAQAYERQGNFEQSRAVLEQAIRRSPLEAANHGCLADMLWKLEEREKALDHVQRAVKLDPDYRWGWDALRSWSIQLKKPQLAVETARELTVGRAGESRSWMVLARALSGEENLQERLGALAKAAELNPRDADPHDMRAQLLALAGRFDEALSACKPAMWGEHPPTRLRARAAWIEAQRGDLNTAIAQMRDVVAESTAYYWAWTCLADWYRELQDNEHYLEAARELARMYPSDTVSKGYLGEALLRSGDREGARSVLRQAVEAAPDYEFGAGLLFEMAMTDKLWSDARTALKTLQVHAPGPLTTRRRGVFAASQGDTQVAIECLRELCGPDANGADAIGPLAQAMEKAGMSQHAEHVLREAANVEHAPAGVANRLVELLVRQQRWPDARQFTESVKSRENVWSDAASTLLFQLGAAEQTSELQAFLRSCGDETKSDPKLWGWVGYALQSVREYPAVLRWMNDWRQRSGVEAWMLVNLAEALRALGRDAEARPIHDHALTLKAEPHPRGIHTLWLAADAALAGDTARAQSLLSRPETTVRSTAYEFLRAMVEAAVAANLRRPPKEIIPRIEKARSAHANYRKDQELYRLYKRCLRRFIVRGPGLQLRWWALRGGKRTL